MAKFVVDEEVAMATIEKWQSGELTKALFRDVFSKSQEVKCCDTCGDGRGPFAETQKTCATCGNGSKPLTAGGVRGKCHCKHYRTYEKPTHYCAAWKEKRKNASE